MEVAVTKVNKAKPMTIMSLNDRLTNMCRYYVHCESYGPSLWLSHSISIYHLLSLSLTHPASSVSKFPLKASHVFILVVCASNFSFNQTVYIPRNWLKYCSIKNIAKVVFWPELNHPFPPQIFGKQTNSGCNDTVLGGISASAQRSVAKINSPVFVHWLSTCFIL